MKTDRKIIAAEKKNNKKIRIGILLLTIILLPVIYRLTVNYFPYSLVKLFLKKQILKPIGDPGIKEKTINFFAEKNLYIENINIFDNKIEIKIKDGPKVILNKNDLEKQVTSLQWILERFKIEGRQVKTIDLRFSKVIIN